MKSEWIDTTIGDQITLQRGFDITKAQQEPGQIPVISSGGVSSYHNTAMVKGPGVVLGRKGTVGTVFYVEENYWPHDTTLWVKDFKNNDQRFVYYFFVSFSKRLAGLDVGTANPTLNRNHIHPIPVRWPPIEEQQEIARVLTAFDNKIELNRKINATLENMARALFKSWFIDFDPVKAKASSREPECMDAETSAFFPTEFEESELGWIPKGWRVTGLDNIATFLNGLPLQNYPPESEDEFLPVIKIAQLRKGDTEGCGKASRNLNSEYIVQDGDILFSWSGSLEVIPWCGGEGALNQHLFKVSSFQYPKWFYYLWTKHHLPAFREIAAHKATTMGHIQRRHLTEAKVIVPPASAIQGMSKVFAPLLFKQINGLIETRGLDRLRSELLPRLVSGKIPIPPK